MKFPYIPCRRTLIAIFSNKSQKTSTITQTWGANDYFMLFSFSLALVRSHTPHSAAVTVIPFKALTRFKQITSYAHPWCVLYTNSVLCLCVWAYERAQECGYELTGNEDVDVDVGILDMNQLYRSLHPSFCECVNILCVNLVYIFFKYGSRFFIK